jgi:hypothetical protein
VAPVSITGTTGTPGKYLAASFSAGPTTLGSSGGGDAIGVILPMAVILMPGSPMIRFKAAAV